MSDYPRHRHDFPAADGWIAVTNRGPEPVQLLIEPWGSVCEMPPGERFYVHIGPERSGHPAQIEVQDGLFVVHGGDAIYRAGQEVIDFTG